MLFSPCKARSKKIHPFQINLFHIAFHIHHTGITVNIRVTHTDKGIFLIYIIQYGQDLVLIQNNQLSELTASPSSVCQSPSICFKMDVLV